jgi:hypothetical protein
MADTGTDQQQLTEQAKTEAAELEQDIQEAKTEAAEARDSGDTDRAERLETRVGSLETKLDSVLDKLTKLAERPFHPAPEEKPDPAADTTAGDQADGKDTAAGDQADDKPKPKGRRPSRAFFGSRADYDD